MSETNRTEVVTRTTYEVWVDYGIGNCSRQSDHHSLAHAKGEIVSLSPKHRRVFVVEVTRRVVEDSADARQD